MDKAILVIDMPNNCLDCPCCETWEVIPSIEEYTCKLKNISVDKYDKPDWCPLKLLPNKKTGFQYADGYDYADGWNECIDKILSN